MAAYYNENEPFAAAWLRNLIAAGHIAPGDVDERDIRDVRPDDLRGYTQCHFFAGIGGWGLALRLAGWGDERPVWTGSCPCQPFSTAGRNKGVADDRHLWPHWFPLIRECRPPVVFGEQVAAAVGKNWLDGVSSDLEGVAYACAAAVAPACAVDAPHRRDRLWFVADAGGSGLALRERDPRVSRSVGGESKGENASHDDSPVGYADERGREQGVHDTPAGHRDPAAADERPGAWSTAGWFLGADGKARRVEPSIRLLAHGVSGRVGRLRAYGNAIVPQVAAEFIGAYLDTEHLRLGVFA